MIQLLIAFLLSCSVAMAGQGMGPGPGVKGYTVNDTETFEGTGRPSGWSIPGVGTWNFDYTSTVLSGEQSFRYTYATNTATYQYSNSFTSSNDVWLTCLIRVVTNTASTSGVNIIGLASGTTSQAYIQLNTTGVVRVFSGANNAAGDTLTTGTTYKLWLHVKGNSGASNITEVWITDTSTTTWPTGTATATITAASTATQMDTVFFGARYNSDVIVDNLKTSTVSSYNVE